MPLEAPVMSATLPSTFMVVLLVVVYQTIDPTAPKPKRMRGFHSRNIAVRLNV
jgi:hypothetical protein